MFITSLNYVMNMAFTSLMVTSWKGYLKRELRYGDIWTSLRLAKSLYFRCHKKSAYNFTSLLTGSMPEQQHYTMKPHNFHMSS